MSNSNIPQMEQIDDKNSTTSTSTSAANNNLVIFAKKTAFVHKLYAMLSDESLSNLIWWSRKDDDCVFALHPGTEFANVLSNYFKHGNVSSFVRQLHMYGFHKVFDLNHDSKISGNEKKKDEDNSNSNKSDDLIWEFRHSTGYFRKGDESSLSLIKRRSSNKSIPSDGIRSVSPVPMNYYYNQPHLSQGHHPQQQQQHQHQHQIHHHNPYPHPSYQNYAAAQDQYHRTPIITSHHYPNQFNHHIQNSIEPRQNVPHLIANVGIPQHTHGSTGGPNDNIPQLRPEEQHQVTNELMRQQIALANQSDALHRDLRSTVSDVLRISDQIPQIAPVLKNPNSVQFRESLGSIQQNFSNRADSYVPSPLSTQHQQQQQQQQQQGPSNPLVPLQRIGSPADPSLVNPFVSSANQRQESIHFWNGSNGRHPSFLIDPLQNTATASTRAGSVISQISGHSIPSTIQDRSMSLTSPVSPNNKILTGHNSADVAVTTTNSSSSSPSSSPSPHKKARTLQTGSLPHIHQRKSPSSISLSKKRTESLNTYLKQQDASLANKLITSPVQNFPPRSVPNDYNPASMNSYIKNPSIPNITHLTSQLRPSLIEIHSAPIQYLNGQNSNPNHSFSGPNQHPNINSISSNSTHHSSIALYSTHSSISSMSSRNSYGSFSGFFPNDNSQSVKGILTQSISGASSGSISTPQFGLPFGKRITEIETISENPSKSETPTIVDGGNETSTGSTSTPALEVAPKLELENKLSVSSLLSSNEVEPAVNVKASNSVTAVQNPVSKKLIDVQAKENVEIPPVQNKVKSVTDLTE